MAPPTARSRKPSRSCRRANRRVLDCRSPIESRRSLQVEPRSLRRLPSTRRSPAKRATNNRWLCRRPSCRQWCRLKALARLGRRKALRRRARRLAAQMPGIEAESRDDHTPAGDKAAATAPVPAPSAGRARVHAAARQRARCRGQVGSRRQCGGRGLGESEAAAGAPTAQHPRQPCARGSRADAQTSASAPTAPTLPPPLPSLPLHAVRDGSGRTTLRPAVLAPPPPRRAQPERIRLDVRGFLAGFALSWAFGVVLYLFMTAG